MGFLMYYSQWSSLLHHQQRSGHSPSHTSALAEIPGKCAPHFSYISCILMSRLPHETADSETTVWGINTPNTRQTGRVPELVSNNRKETWLAANSRGGQQAMVSTQHSTASPWTCHDQIQDASTLHYSGLQKLDSWSELLRSEQASMII